jgi:hypothetical protein
VSSLVFLGIAVGVSILGSLVIAFRNRSARSSGDEVESFSAVMRALAPDDDRGGRQGRT